MAHGCSAKICLLFERVSYIFKSSKRCTSSRKASIASVLTPPPRGHLRNGDTPPPSRRSVLFESLPHLLPRQAFSFVDLRACRSSNAAAYEPPTRNLVRAQGMYFRPGDQNAPGFRFHFLRLLTQPLAVTVANVSSSAASRWSASRFEKIIGGRILRTLSCGPSVPISTPR